MGMKQILYGDVLFFVNFTMDFLTLYVTALILHRRVRPLRMAFASAIGAVYGVAACFMGGWLLFQIAINLAVSFLMCYVAFETKLLSCCALFYGSGCLLGGVMTACYSAIGRVSHTQTIFVDGSYRTLSGEIPLGWMAVVAGITGAAAIAGGRCSARRRTAGDCVLTVEEGGAVHTLHGILDSGNFLVDPLGGRPVIVVNRAVLLPLLPEGLRAVFAAGEVAAFGSLSPELARRVRLIPSRSVGGEAMLLAFSPESLAVNGVERGALLAISPAPLSQDAIVPAVLG